MKAAFIWLAILGVCCMAGLVLYISPQDVQGQLLVAMMFMTTACLLFKVCKGSA